MLHIPVLRGGRPYRSLDVNVLTDVRDGKPVAEVSQANRGLISRDLLNMAERRAQLRNIPIEELIEKCSIAAALSPAGPMTRRSRGRVA